MKQTVIPSTKVMNWVEKFGSRRLFSRGRHKRFDLITSMTAFTSRAYYCNKCNTGYNNKNKHNCYEQNINNGNVDIADKLNNKIIHKKQYQKLTTK